MLSNEKSLSEKVGKRLGFFVGLIIFSTLLFFVGSKFRIIPQGTPYFVIIPLVVAIHIIYSAVKVVIKK